MTTSLTTAAAGSPERQLWAEVVLTAIADALHAGTSAADRQAHSDAVRWFRHAGRDFRAICALAGLDDPEDCRRRVLAAIDGGVRSRTGRAEVSLR